MRSIRLTAVSLGFVGALLASGTARAGLSYVSQERLVRAGAGSALPPGPTSGEEQTRSADGFGPFDARVQGRFLNIYGGNISGDLNETRASQVSRLGENELTAAGRFSASSENDRVRYRSLLDVMFDVPATTSYDLSASYDLARPVDSGRGGEDVRYILRLRAIDGASDGTPLVDKQPERGDLLFGGAFPTASQGTLAAGRYELLLDIEGDFVGTGIHAGSYDLRLTVGADTGGGPAPAVPLPPAVWAGLMTMAATLVAARAGLPLWPAFPLQAA